MVLLVLQLAQVALMLILLPTHVQVAIAAVLIAAVLALMHALRVVAAAI